MIEIIRVDKKLICIDYDGTISEAPVLFQKWIEFAQQFNYKVIIATMRSEEEKDSGLITLETYVDKIYYTNRKAKKKFLADLGVHPWIFIDDRPEWLFMDTF